MAKDAYYFSHDSNARNDPRMVKLRRIGGMELVGLYWCVVEMLRESQNYELDISSIEDVCFELRIEYSKFEALFISELLTQNGEKFYSSSLKRRMKKLDKIKKERAKAGRQGGIAKANAKQMPSKSLANPGNKSIVNESKVNNSKEEIYRAFAHLSITDIEFQKLIDAGYSTKQVDSILDDIENYKQNIKYKSLYLTAVKWLKREPVKGKQEMSGRVIDSERAPDNFGVRSPTSVPMPEHLKKKLGKIGTQK